MLCNMMCCVSLGDLQWVGIDKYEPYNVGTEREVRIVDCASGLSGAFSELSSWCFRVWEYVTSAPAVVSLEKEMATHLLHSSGDTERLTVYCFQAFLALKRHLSTS